MTSRRAWGVARSPDGKAGTSDYTQMTMARDLKNLRYDHRLDTSPGRPIVDMPSKLK